MKRRIVLISVLAAFLVTGLAVPGKADSWFNLGRRIERGSGDIVSEERELEPFERIVLESSADLIVTVGEEQRVIVTADDNLLDNIVTEVTGHRTLVIDSEGSFRTRRGIRIEVSLPHLKLLEVDGSGDVEIANLKEELFEVELDGSGDIEFDGEIEELEISVRGSGSITALELVCETIGVRSHGSGDIELRGQAESIDLTVHGSGDVDARRLKASDVIARVHGSGDVSVYAEVDFDGAVYGSGDIDVYGNPENLDRHVSGSGDISRH